MMLQSFWLECKVQGHGVLDSIQCVSRNSRKAAAQQHGCDQRETQAGLSGHGWASAGGKNDNVAAIVVTLDAGRADSSAQSSSETSRMSTTRSETTVSGPRIS